MQGLIELTGLAIVGLALAHAAFGLAGTLQRRAAQLRLAREEARLFERRAGLLLSAAEAERDQKQLSWTGLRKFTITDKVVEAEDVCSFYLTPHDQKPLPPFEPGQYLTFQLRIPGAPKPIIRCYSLSDAPLNLEHYRVTIKYLRPPPDKPDAPAGLSSGFFHETLRIGDTVDVRAPSGQFVLDRSHERPVVLIGGGVGLTPLLSILNTICNSDDGRETWLFYGVQHGRAHAMKQHLADMAREHPNLNVITCYSTPGAEDSEGVDYQHSGHLDVDFISDCLPSSNYEFYVCGPPPMMEGIVGGLRGWGVPEESVHVEAFGPASVKTAPRQAEDADAAPEPSAAEVEFARSGKRVTWTAGDGALLDLAETHGVSIDFGCRAGNCGTCLTAIKEGKVDYLSEPGAPPEDGSCLTCVAVPQGRLVLDA